MSVPKPWRAAAFAKKRMARPVGGAQAGGNCTFPRAGAAAGRSWVLWTQHACRRVEPLARRGLQDRLGWGSNAGTAPSKFRPPPQPSPCPGAGARTSTARHSEPRLHFTMQNALFLERPQFSQSAQRRLAAAWWTRTANGRRRRRWTTARRWCCPSARFAHLVPPPGRGGRPGRSSRWPADLG